MTPDELRAIRLLPKFRIEDRFCLDEPQNNLLYRYWVAANEDERAYLDRAPDSLLNYLSCRIGWIRR